MMQYSTDLALRGVQPWAGARARHLFIKPLTLAVGLLTRRVLMGQECGKFALLMHILPLMLATLDI